MSAVRLHADSLASSTRLYDYARELEVEVERLRAALEPFAATTCTHITTGGQDEDANRKQLDDLRAECRYCRARDALAAATTPEEDT
jgi:hypothetical protein